MCIRDRARAVKVDGYTAKIEASALRAGLATVPDTKALIGDYLQQRIEAGQIKDRSGVLAALAEAGLEINRQSADFISVRPEPGAKPIRLKGGIYAEHFNSAELVRAHPVQDPAGQAEPRQPDPGLSLIHI